MKFPVYHFYSADVIAASLCATIAGQVRLVPTLPSFNPRYDRTIAR